MLQVRGISKIYASADGQGGGVRDASFEVGRGEFYTLLGPSGCGKTTTLRCIAGLEEPDSGAIEIAGRRVFDGTSGASVAMNNRDIGMVFQSYAVWPHMTVYQNVAFPLEVSRRRRYSHSEIRERVQRVLDVVGLGGLASRPAPLLSGGQQQRLALARAVVAEPQLLLFDEPLSNLDAQLRDQMREELRRLQRDLAVTAVYVTHDQSEALALSDKIAVLHDGRIIQIGSPNEIYSEPKSLFVATFVGKINLVDAICPSKVSRAGFIEAGTALGPIQCRIPTDFAADTRLRIAIRPEDIALSRAGGNAHNGGNLLRGRIVNRVFLGELNEYHLTLQNGVTFLVRGRFPPDVDTGNDVEMRFPPERTLGLRADAPAA